MRTPWTPRQIKEIYDRDVFAETVGKLQHEHQEYVDELVRSCWNAYGHRVIGDYDWQLWLEILDGTVKSSWAWYSRIITAVYDGRMLDLETVTGKTITSTKNKGNASQGGTGNSKTITESEDKPDTIPDDLKYLSARNETEINSSDTGSSNYEDESDSTTETTGTTGLYSDTMISIMENLKTVTNAFTVSLEKMFCNRW